MTTQYHHLVFRNIAKLRLAATKGDKANLFKSSKALGILCVCVCVYTPLLCILDRVRIVLLMNKGGTRACVSKQYDRDYKRTQDIACMLDDLLPISQQTV